MPRRLARRGAARACPSDRGAGAARVGRSALPCGSCPVAVLLATLGPDNVFSQIATFFSTMAVVTFGGAYAVLAYVAQQAVENYGWLQPGEMLDGLGMAETTPGPLIMVLQFVGFMGAFRDPGALSPLTAGMLGGLLATWVTFVPCFLFIFLGAPFIEVLRGNQALHGALSAITAAVVGVVLNLAIWFAIHTVFRETWPVRGLGLSFDAPGARERRPLGAAALGGGGDRHVPVQGRHDPDARRLLGGRRRPLSRGGDLMMRGYELAVLAPVASLAPALSPRRRTRTSPTRRSASRRSTSSPVQTGPGKPGRWEIVEDDKASGGRALAQVSQDPTDYRFPLLIYMPTVPADVEVRTRLRPISGRSIRPVAWRSAFSIRTTTTWCGRMPWRETCASTRWWAASASSSPAPTSRSHPTMAQADPACPGRPVHRDVRRQGVVHRHGPDRSASPGKVAFWTKADSITRFDSLTSSRCDSRRGEGR